MTKVNQQKSDVKEKDNGRSFVKNTAEFHPQQTSQDQLMVDSHYSLVIRQWLQDQPEAKDLSQLSQQDLEDIAARAQIADYENMSKGELRRSLGLGL